MKDLGKVYPSVHHYLGVDFVLTSSWIMLHQKPYIQSTLDNYEVTLSIHIFVRAFSDQQQQQLTKLTPISILKSMAS